MKAINIIWVCVVICFGVEISCYAQRDTRDKVLLERIERIYHGIPQDLKTGELLEKLREAEKQVGLVLDSLSAKDMKERGQLFRYNGLLWSLGTYVVEGGDQVLKSELAERIGGLDLDSPRLELLSDLEAANLLNGYFRVFMPEMSDVERATYVLYNVKSEKVRNPYVLSVLVLGLKQRGYTDEVQNLLEDIELCSKTETTLQEARKLKERYYPVRAGVLAPDFEMEDESGKMVKLSDFKGKVVFIDVWATWCGGCVEGLPYFMALKDRYKDRDDIVFLTISDDGIEAKERWRNFLKERKYAGKMPHLLMNREKDDFEKNYCITGIPRYILIDKEGKIVNAWHVAVKHELFPWFFKIELDNMN
ncbi:TlpA family protein disulfide reductase [Butyricimonas paravirosa]